jgi:hypothetical protein
MIPRERQIGVAPSAARASPIDLRLRMAWRLCMTAPAMGGQQHPATSDGPVGHTVECEGVAARRGAGPIGGYGSVFAATLPR